MDDRNTNRIPEERDDAPARLLLVPDAMTRIAGEPASVVRQLTLLIKKDVSLLPTGVTGSAQYRGDPPLPCGRGSVT
jgi:hypothetical protein